MTHHLTVSSMKVFNWAFPIQVQHFTRPCPLHTSHLLTKKQPKYKVTVLDLKKAENDFIFTQFN